MNIQNALIPAANSITCPACARAQNTLNSHVADFGEVEASARAAAGVAVAAAGTAVAGAAAAGLPAVASSSGSGGGGGAEVAAAVLGQEMRGLRQRLEGVETRVGEVIGALTAHTAALRAQAQAVTAQQAAAAAARAGQQEGATAAGPGKQETERAAGGSRSDRGSAALAESVRNLEDAAAENQEAAGGQAGAGAALRRWGRRGVRWGAALAGAVRRAADTPEVVTGAAAFAGAALGVGLALALSSAAGSSGGAANSG